MAPTIKKKRESIKKMKPDELKRELSTLEDNLRVLRFKSEGSKSKNVKEEKDIKKQIARVLTTINQH